MNWFIEIGLLACITCESVFTVQERFEVLMEATGGGKVMPSFDLNDFEELIVRPLQAKQEVPYAIVLYYTYLGPAQPKFQCNECRTYLQDLHLVANHTQQGQGMEKVFFAIINYSETMTKAFQAFQVPQVPVLVYIPPNGQIRHDHMMKPNTAEMPFATTEQFKNSDNDLTMYLTKFLQKHGVTVKDIIRPINWKLYIYKGIGLLLALQIFMWTKPFIFSKYSFALLITITCAFCTTGAAFLRIRKSPRGTFEDLRIGSGTWMESFLVVGNKMAFFVGLILMNWENQKRSLTATVGLVMIVAAYINYWVMYKEVKKTYPYSPYHLL